MDYDTLDDQFAEDSRKSLEVFHLCVHELESIANSLSMLATSFFDVGNESMGERLDNYSYEITNVAKKLRHERHGDISREYKYTMNQTGRILGALLDRCEEEIAPVALTG